MNMIIIKLLMRIPSTEVKACCCESSKAEVYECSVQQVLGHRKEPMLT